MKALILGSGSNVSVKVSEEYVKSTDCTICADGGLEKAEILNLNPDIIIGDMDSVNKDLLTKYLESGTEILKYPSEKNYTDMELAIEHAIEKGYKDITLLGASGTRLDHTVANIILIERYYKKGIKLKIIDNNNTIQMIESKMILRNKINYFVSIVPVSETIKGLTLKGFKYPLDNVEVERGSTLCISNEIQDEEGIILLREGTALLFISKD